MKFPFDVIHDKYGIGEAREIVCKGENRYVKIFFYDDESVKEFIYPDQFVFHITALDDEIHKEILKTIGSSIDPAPVRASKVLSEGIIIGKRGIDVYDICCDYFGWDKGKRSFFDKHGIMYAYKVTPERYSVWMIVHNSLVEPSYNGVSSWYNVVKGDTLEEIWFTDDRGSAKVSDISIRVTFLKTKDGYMFKGVYKLSDAELREINGQHRMVKIYKMISNKYPTRPEWM